MSGRTAVFTLLSGVLLAAGSAAAGDPPAKAEEREIRVFVSDDKGTFLDGAAGSVTLTLEIEGVRATLQGEAVGTAKKAAPKSEADPKSGADARAVELRVEPVTHGGQVVVEEKHRVELVVFVPSVAKEEAGTPVDRAVAEPYFIVRARAVAYQDAMKCVPPAEKAGKCPKCGMEMKEIAVPFTAEVVVKIGERTFTAKGFRYPVQDPATYAEALACIERQLAAIAGSAASTQPADVRKAAVEISRVAGTLESLASAGDRTAVRLLGQGIVDLFAAIHKAEDAGNGDERTRAVVQCREKLASLKKLS